MFSRVRKPSLSSTISSNTTFSSDNFYIPTLSTVRPNILYPLNVHDLDEINSIDFITQRAIHREPFRIPRPILTIPRPSIYLPTTNTLWTPVSRPKHVHQASQSSLSSLSSSSPFSISHYSERPIYQNIPLEPIRTHLPSPFLPPPPPPPPPPFIPTQYQIGPPRFQRYSHNRIVQPIRKKRYVRERPPGLVTTLSTGGLTTVLGLIYLVFLLATPIAKLVIGVLYVQECPVNKNIPLYIIVSGVCGLALVALLIFTSACAFYRSTLNATKRTHGFIICITAFTRALRGVLKLFLFIWFFYGNVWVFNVRYRVRTDKLTDATNYCHPTLYWFVFYGLIFTYVYAFLTCCMKFCVNFFCCGMFDGLHKALS